ncbi:MAG: hypothetical protein NT067_06560 [Candidatus Diapherotrites archaeon]|nr:hypothetical protein [Candidatus Diapherotrites archaeon]
MKAGIIPTLIIVAVLLCGCTWLPSNPEATPAPGATTTATPAQTLTITPTPVQTPSGEIILEIRIPKTTCAVGEAFNGKYYMKYDGEPFRGLIHYCASRQGFDCNVCSRTSGVLENIDFDKGGQFKVALQPVKINDTGIERYCLGGEDSFEEAGTYTYTMSVFKCADIEKELGVKDCGWGEEGLKEGLLGMTPLKTTAKSVTIIGNQQTPTPALTPTPTPTPMPTATPTPAGSPALGEDTYQAGDIITGLEGAGEYEGQAVSIKVMEIWSANEVQVSLLNQDGEEISSITLPSGSWLEQSFMDSTSNYALATKMQITKIKFNQATGYGTVVIKVFS